VDNK
jgi:hypothetical protein